MPRNSLNVLKSSPLICLLFVLALTTFSCAEDAEVIDAVTDTEGCAGQKCDGGRAEPVTAPEWARCWIVADQTTTDPFYILDELLCRANPLDTLPTTPALLGLKVFDRDGTPIAGTNLEPTSSEAVVVAKIQRSQYPLRVMVDSTLSPSALDGIEGFEMWRMEGTVEHELSTPGAAPLVFMQPFDLWPVTLLVTPGAFAVDLDSYEASLGDWVHYYNAEHVESFTMTRSVVVTEEGVIDLMLPAPADGAGIGGTLYTQEMSGGRKILIDSPGTWIVDGSILRPASLEEIAGFGQPGTPGVGPNADPGALVPDAGLPCEEECGALSLCLDGACVPRAAQTSGAPCLVNAQCASEAYVCVALACTVAAAQVVGATCETDLHCTGGAGPGSGADLVCLDDGVCAARAAQKTGARCSLDGQCADGWSCDGKECFDLACSGVDCSNTSTCVAGVCQAFSDVKKEGGCTANEQCEAAYYSPGYVCVLGTCHATWSQKDGAACAVDSQCAEGGGYSCVLGACRASWAQKDGAACGADSHCYDEGGYLCVLGACRALWSQKDSATCLENVQCADGYLCVQGACAPSWKQTGGATCEASAQCATGYTCDLTAATCQL